MVIVTVIKGTAQIVLLNYAKEINYVKII